MPKQSLGTPVVLSGMVMQCGRPMILQLTHNHSAQTTSLCEDGMGWARVREHGAAVPGLLRALLTMSDSAVDALPGDRCWERGCPAHSFPASSFKDQDCVRSRVVGIHLPSGSVQELGLVEAL